MKHRAFTLIEALVVVIILAIGAAILAPAFYGGTPRPNKHRSQCQSNLKQIGLAFMQYAQDFDEKAPPVANAQGGWARLILPYLKSEAIFQCPSTSVDKTGATDYFTNARLAGTTGKLSRNVKIVATTILCGDGADDENASYNLSQFPDAWRTNESSPAWRHLDGANSLFVDGHVKWFGARRIFSEPDAATPTFEVKP